MKTLLRVSRASDNRDEHATGIQCAHGEHGADIDDHASTAEHD